MKEYILHITEAPTKLPFDNLFVTNTSINGYKIHIGENGEVNFEEPDNPIKNFRGFNSATGVFATDDNRFIIAAKNGDLYIFGNNADGQIQEKTMLELYRTESEQFQYSWDPYFEHPAVIYEKTATGSHPLRYWNATDTENYMKKKFFDKNFIFNNVEMYHQYIEACNKYGEKNIVTDIVFDVDFNTPIYRNGDYYRQDFNGHKNYVIGKTNNFIYKPIKLT